MDNASQDEEGITLLQHVFINGNLYNEQSFKNIRERLAAYDE
jgi:hypothetical protein